MIKTPMKSRIYVNTYIVAVCRSSLTTATIKMNKLSKNAIHQAMY